MLPAVPSSDEANTPEPQDLTEPIARARRGLRSVVAQLIHALEQGELLIPLAKPIEGAEEGQRQEIEEELTLCPHLLLDDEGAAHLAVFTRSELAEPIAASVGWTTGDDGFACCSLPARVALDLALEVVDDKRILGLVINPGHESELLLRRSEVAALHQRKAIPLVGYVRQLQADDGGETLEAQPDAAPAPELLEALERQLDADPRVRGYQLKHTFNPERDLEPHPSLIVQVVDEPSDYAALAQSVTQALEPHLAPPGYIDILFESHTTDPEPQ